MNHFISLSPYAPDRESALKRAMLDPESEEAEDFLELLDKMAAVAVPKAFIANARVDASPEPPAVLVNGIEFNGSILHENIKDLSEVWPFLATCGREMYDFVNAMPNPFERYWGDIIMEDALEAAVKELDVFFKREISGEKTAIITPGSLVQWPIEQQTPLFRLLGDGAERCGITLTDTMLMLPNKTISGFRFHNEHGYVNCRFCPRENCQGRKAEYEPEASMMGL